MRFVSIDSNQPLPNLEDNYWSNIALDDWDTAQHAAQQDAGESIRLSIETADGKIWVEGNSLFCACPKCEAPLSVRMWLLTADCWQCDTRIELTREQEQAVEKLLKSQATAQPEANVTQPVARPAMEPAPAPQAEPRRPQKKKTSPRCGRADARRTCPKNARSAIRSRSDARSLSHDACLADQFSVAFDFDHHPLDVVHREYA